MLFRFLKDYGKPVLWTLHDCWSFTGFCASFDYHQCSSWKTGCQHCPYRNTYPYRVFSHSAQNLQWKKQAYEGLNLTLAVPSQWLRKELQQSILQDKPCTVIHNSIDTGIFYEEPSNLRTQYHLEGKRVYLACANLWTMPKGYGELKKLSAMLNDNEVLVIIGLSEKQQKEFHGHVLTLGNMDSASLRHWYSTADCFVNLTLEDNYPTVNLEARACGCPVVTYNTGGSPESAGNPNLVAKRNDLEQIMELLRINDRRNSEPVPPASHMTEEYLRLYESVLKDL
jgi:glycosyltransferase involved in cell wall biosynthesis